MPISHTGSGGTNAGDRIAAEGYAATAWGENIAAGFLTAESVVTAWLDSPGHRDNMRNGLFTDAGIGFVEAGANADFATYWTLELAAGDSAPVSLPQMSGAVADDSDTESDEDRGCRRHEPGGRGDRHEPGDRADRGAEHRGRPLVQPADGDPRDGGHRRRRVGRDEGGGGQAVRAKGGAGVEAEPAEPEQAGAEDRHRHVVRFRGRLDEPGAAADEEGGDECRDTGYLGRTGVFEVMPMTEALQKLVQDGALAADLKRAAVADGMQTLRNAALDRALAGETSLEEVLRAIA